MPGSLIVTVDVEDWYMSPEGISCDHWEGYPDRLAIGLERLLELFARYHVSATFFWLGHLAQAHPRLVGRCCAEGHEVAMHGWDHRPVWMLGRVAFGRSLLATRQLLQDLSGQSVCGYRAPEYSLRQGCRWMWQVLQDCGVTYDSSLNPVATYLYGSSENKPFLHGQSVSAAGFIAEWPISTVTWLGRRWPVASGGFLRILPACWLPVAVQWWERETAAADMHGDAARIVLNIHPWELDPQQPDLPLSPRQRWIHRTGLSTTTAKLEWLLAASDSLPMGTAVVNTQSAGSGGLGIHR